MVVEIVERRRARREDDLAGAGRAESLRVRGEGRIKQHPSGLVFGFGRLDRLLEFPGADDDQRALRVMMGPHRAAARVTRDAQVLHAMREGAGLAKSAGANRNHSAT